MRQRGRIWWIRYYRNGRRYEESSGSTKKGAAISLLKIREGDSARGLPVTPKIGRLRFEEATADVTNDYKVNGRRTLTDVERRIKKHLTPFFGGRRMASITTADVRKFIAERQDAGATSAGINRELSVLKRAYKLALQSGKLLHAPHVPMLKENNVRQGFFERETFEAVRAELPEPLRPVVTFGYLTGWRIQSEVLPLQWHQVNRRAGVVRLEPGTTKNDEGRTFPYRDLLPELRETLEAQWKEHEDLEAKSIISPWVFPRLRGAEPGGRIASFRKAWKTACGKAGCPQSIPHDFRRSAVRNLVRASVPERTAMMLTGHKTRSVFDRYDIVNEADLEDAVRKLGESAKKGTQKGQLGRSGVVRRMSKSVNHKEIS